MKDLSTMHAKIDNVLDAIVDDRRKEPDHDYISKLITDHYSSQLFQIVADIMENKSLEEQTQYETEAEYYEDEAEGYRSDYGEELDGSDGVFRDQLEPYWEEQPDYYADTADGKKRRGAKDSVQTRKNIHVEARKRREREKILREKRKWEFPEKIGSHHNYQNPALEFSKFISAHVFGLDEAFYVEA